MVSGVSPVVKARTPRVSRRRWPQRVGEQRQRGRRQQRADHRRQRADRAGDVPADDGDEQHVRARRRLRDRDRGAELRVADPVVLVDDVAVHVGRGRDRAADGEQAEDEEVGEQAEQVGVADSARVQHAASSHGARA